MKYIKEKHSIVMRWTHWINFPILLIMTWSGLLIYWANGVYSLSLFGFEIFPFFSAGFYDFFNLNQRLAEGMAYHFMFMWFFAINGLLYVLYTAISGEWRALLPNKKSFQLAWDVFLHDLGYKKIILPKKKYNEAQKIAYTAIIIMGFGSLLTGLAIYKPIQFNGLLWILGGYNFARIIHFALTMGYVLFFLIHVFQVIRAGWNNFRSVVSGYEQVEEEVTVDNSLKK